MQLHCRSLSSILLSGCKQVKLQVGSSFINIEITRTGTLLSAVLCNSLIYNPDHCSHMPKNLKTEAKTVYPRCPVKKKCQDTCLIKYAWSSTAPVHNIPASKFTPLHTELCSCSPVAALCSTWVRLSGWDQTWSFALCFMVRTDAVVTRENMMCRPLVSGEALRPAPYPCVHRWSLVFV